MLSTSGPPKTKVTLEQRIHFAIHSCNVRRPLSYEKCPMARIRIAGLAMRAPSAVVSGGEVSGQRRGLKLGGLQSNPSCPHVTCSINLIDVHDLCLSAKYSLNDTYQGGHHSA